MNALRWIPLCAAVLSLALVGEVDCKKHKAKKESTKGKLRTVSVGRSGVWGVNKKNEVFYREDTFNNPTNIGSSWGKIDSGGLKFKQVDVGDKIVWAVTQKDKVYVRENMDSDQPSGDDWKKLSGSISHVTVSPAGYVWGVNNKHNVFYRKDASKCDDPEGRNWKKVGGSLVQISAGYAGVWGVNKKNELFYLENTFGDVAPPPKKNNWIKVDTDFVYVSSGDGFVTAIDEKGQVHVRIGITADDPTGKSWNKVVTEKMVAVDNYRLSFWAVSKDDKTSRNDLHPL